ncbi:MAG: hypothetical protein ACK5QC_00945 [Bacteroidota bacterium]|nr:hypothetical protein [Bacteroidota bacterium]MCA6444791.1 hypothetical protein [Bacteroidota bacterium]
MNQKKLGFIISFLLLINIFSAQPKKDTVIFSKYRLQLNFGSRIELYSVGIERLGILNKKLNFSSQLNFNTGIFGTRLNAGSQTKYNPFFVAFNLQPFHLLVGKNLQFETGPSFGLNFYRFNGSKYPLDTSNYAYNTLRDRFELFYMLGARYTLPKQQVSFKFLVGVKYTTSMFKYNINRAFACFESSVLYTFRKKVYKKKYYNELKRTLH